jgi:hypothetical protein
VARWPGTSDERDMVNDGIIIGADSGGTRIDLAGTAVPDVLAASDSGADRLAVGAKVRVAIGADGSADIVTVI